MQIFSIALMAALASAQTEGPTLIESKMDHFSASEEEANDKYDVVITQISGQQNWIMLPQDTKADSDPVCTACTEKFYVGGIWNIANVDLDHVNFQCKLAGAVAYNADYPCDGSSSESNDYGNCPKPTGAIGEEWKADFGFDVPGFAPPFLYEVTITGYDSAGASLFQLGSNFYIP